MDFKPDNEHLCTLIAVCVRPWRIYVCALCDVTCHKPGLAERLAQLIRNCVLQHFTDTRDREHALQVLLSDAAELPGMKEELDTDPDEDNEFEAEAIVVQDAGQTPTDNTPPPDAPLDTENGVAVADTCFRWGCACGGSRNADTRRIPKQRCCRNCNSIYGESSLDPQARS